MSTKKVLCFGELLLRMSPRLNGEWIQQHHISTYVGGAELNVATALAKWNIPAKYVTALPDHSLSQDLISYLNEKNIDSSSVLFTGNRIGLYFLPQGSDLKNAGVIYDRAYSSFWELLPGMYDWDKILVDVSWLHFSAISPGLNANVAAVCLELLKIASQKGIFISLDLNYRAKLWKYGKDPLEIMPELASYCDLIMGNIWAAEKLLGISIDNKLIESGNKDAYLMHAELTSKAMLLSFPKIKTVANTFRFDTAQDEILYYATLFTEGRQFVSKEIQGHHIKDKIGSGDCFMGGLIYGFHQGLKPEQIINFSAAAAVGKMYETSDATDQDLDQIISNSQPTKEYNHE
jgi:2-dehydro-3-deoxygluconokinase